MYGVWKWCIDLFNLKCPLTEARYHHWVGELKNILVAQNKDKFQKKFRSVFPLVNKSKHRNYVVGLHISSWFGNSQWKPFVFWVLELFGGENYSFVLFFCKTVFTVKTLSSILNQSPFWQSLFFDIQLRCFGPIYLDGKLCRSCTALFPWISFNFSNLTMIVFLDTTTRAWINTVTLDPFMSRESGFSMTHWTSPEYHNYISQGTWLMCFFCEFIVSQHLKFQIWEKMKFGGSFKQFLLNDCDCDVHNSVPSKVTVFLTNNHKIWNAPENWGALCFGSVFSPFQNQKQMRIFEVQNFLFLFGFFPNTPKHDSTKLCLFLTLKRYNWWTIKKVIGKVWSIDWRFRFTLFLWDPVRLFWMIQSTWCAHEGFVMKLTFDNLIMWTELSGREKWSCCCQLDSSESCW